jgi:hypothetical protein
MVKTGNLWYYYVGYPLYIYLLGLLNEWVYTCIVSNIIIREMIILTIWFFWVNNNRNKNMIFMNLGFFWVLNENNKHKVPYIISNSFNI